ncbi:MAG TPA: hypothetical protein VFU72_13975 [Nitrolancea sp.]|nr:hypothetical protein [Nitrolancea sp.]
MDPTETQREPPPRQLPLPLPAPPPARAVAAPPAALAPGQLWPTLLPGDRLRVRAALLRALREVVDEP